MGGIISSWLRNRRNNTSRPPVNTTTQECKTQSTSTPEYAAMRNCYDQLVLVVKESYSTVGDAMFSRGFISHEGKEFLRMDTKLPVEKAEKLMDTMLDRVKCFPDSYHGFVNILEKEGPWADEAVKALGAAYEANGGCTVTTHETQSLEGKGEQHQQREGAVDVLAQGHEPAVNVGINVGQIPPLLGAQLHQEGSPPLQEGQQNSEQEPRHNVVNLEENGQHDLKERYPQPTDEGFSYLSSPYQKSAFVASGNAEADRIAKKAQEYFTENAINPRLQIDTALRHFKKLTNRDEDHPLPACFCVWMDMADENDSMQERVFRVEYDENGGVTNITAFTECKTPAVIEIENKMKELLTLCHKFLAGQKDVRRILNDLIAEFQCIHVRTLKTDQILRDIESLPVEVNAMCEQVTNLLNDIQAAVPHKNSRKATFNYWDSNC